MTHGSLFSGIGGFDLAAEWAGWENKFHCEWNEFGQRVLKYYWPHAVSYGDITQTDFTVWKGRIDVITGGFPCQPYSTAGKRLGKEDERHLWPEMLRVIREVQPRYVVGENVPGLVNWNGGLVFDEVQTDLENAGYEVIPFILPACGVNAPHRRERIWFIAHRNNAGLQTQRTEQQTTGIAGSCIQRTTTNSTSDRREWERTGIEIEKGLQQRPESTGKLEGGFEGLCAQGNATNSDKFNGNISGFRTGEVSQFKKSGIFKNNATNTSNTGLQGSQDNRSIGINRTESNKQPARFFRTDWKDFPTQSPVCNGDDGFPGRLDGITFSKWRNESIKAGGNAIVPQVAYQIFKAINEYDIIYQKKQYKQ